MNMNLFDYSTVVLIAYHYSFVCMCRYQSMVYYQCSFLFLIESHHLKCHMLLSMNQRIPMLSKILRLKIDKSKIRPSKINISCVPHFDSFLFHLKFLCMASYHYKALNESWCLYCKSLSKHPNHPMLSMPPQLKNKSCLLTSFSRDHRIRQEFK